MNEIDEIIFALSEEIKAVKQKYRQNPIKINHHKITNVSGDYFYEGIVVSLEEGDMLSIPEGVPIRIIYKEYERLSSSWVSHKRDGKLLYYDSSNHHIVIHILGIVIPFDERNTQYSIQPVVEELLMALQNNLKQKEFYATSFGTQILHNRYLKPTNTYNYSSLIEKLLNISQQESIKNIFKNNISYLWGPPGTGKTTTLATIIHELRALNKKVLAISISNIAVDQIALKCIDVNGYPLLKRGEIVRFGYARLPKVRDQDILFPERENINRLRKELKNLEEKKSEALIPILKANFEKKIAEKQKEIKEATILPLFISKIVLTTATQVCLTEDFKDIKFDVVIIDEASMMSIAMVIFLSGIAAEKIIISGDYRQLQPIAISKNAFVKKWLQRDVFELAGISKGGKHEMLSMLSVQHRMVENICEIINHAFYFDKLQTHIKEENRTGSFLPPQNGHSIVFCAVRPPNDSVLQRTDNHSRYNVPTSKKVIDLIDKIVRQPKNVQIGVITPYAAQAQRIKKIIQERSKKAVNPKYKYIKVGTIHSFQGDESDIIILDFVDNSIEGPGVLFKKGNGERLINVAISRAKGKLIVIGDPDLFKNHIIGYEKTAIVYNLLYNKYKSGEE